MRAIPNIKNILEETPPCLSAALIMIKTKSDEVELREERGKWLGEIFDELKPLDILEYRSTWDELYLFSPDMQQSNFEKSLVSKLRELTHSDLDSYLLISTIVGTSQEKLGELDKMQLQLHKINYWSDHVFDNYYKNGDKIDLKNS